MDPNLMWYSLMELGPSLIGQKAADFRALIGTGKELRDMAYRDSLVPFPVPSIWNYSREEIPGVSLEKRGIFWYVVRRSPTKELELETIICCRQGCDAMPLTYTGMCKEHSIQESVPVLAPESAEGTPVRGFVSRSTNMSQFDQFLDKTLGSSVQCTAAVTPNPQTPFPRAGCSRAQEIQKVSLLIPRMAMQTKNLQPSADSKSSSAPRSKYQKL